MNNMNPLVTIITPSFNQGQFIERTILSVLNQSYKNIEYIVIDGGSTDNTKNIIEKYKDCISILVHEKDRGQSDAINKGLRLATGGYITWLNSDDTLKPDAVESLISTLNRDTESKFVYGDVELIDENSNFIGLLKGRQVFKPEMYYELDLPIPQQGAMWERSVIEGVGFLDEKWHYVLDREFFLRICLKYNSKYINITLGCFRQHKFSKSIAMKNSWINELPSMYDDLVSLPFWPYSPKINDIIKASSRVHASYLAFAAGKVRIGFEYLLEAFVIDCFIFFRWHIYTKLFKKILKILFGRS